MAKIVYYRFVVTWAVCVGLINQGLGKSTSKDTVDGATNSTVRSGYEQPGHNHSDSEPAAKGKGTIEPGIPAPVDWEAPYDPQPDLTKPTPTKMEAEVLEAKLYLMRIFNKYGEGGTMSFEGFEHLLENLGLGHVRIEDHDIHDHYDNDGAFKELHPDHHHNNRTGINKKDGKHHGDHEEEHDHDLHHEHDDQAKDDLDHDLGKPHQGREHQGHEHQGHEHQGREHQGREHQGHNKEKHGHVIMGQVGQGQGAKGHGHNHDKHKGHPGDDLEHQHPNQAKVYESSTSVNDESTVLQNATIPLANTTRLDPNRNMTTTNGSTSSHHHRSQRALAEEDLAHIDHGHVEKKCLTTNEILLTYEIQYEGGISKTNLMNLCPAIIYQIDEHSCAKPPPCPTFHEDREFHCNSFHDDHSHDNHSDAGEVHKISLLDHFWNVPGKVWGFAILSVTIISLVGLLSVAVIPIMNKVFYNHLLQFLVALAIGSLTGDALLHLIPHALEAPHDDGGHDDHGTLGDHGEQGGHSKDGVYKGLVALFGIYSFFIMERAMGMFSEWKRTRQKKKRNPPPSVFKNDLDEIGQKLSKHNDQYASCADFMMVVHPSKAVKKMAEEAHEELKELKSCEDTSHGCHRDDSESNASCRDDNHADHGHGHSHGGHGHSHKVPSSVSSIAWMVIMGDGLHNFTDGLAIGASFSTGMSAGLSTSVAVFCHELPHELGDFAVLLRAGMSVRQALIYNVVSSVLCFIGMVIGVFVGNIASASQWVFALTAGIFIYISLVDMLPEITSIEVAKQRSKCCHLLLQCLGISLGVTVMLVIALFEDKIQLNVGDDNV